VESDEEAEERDLEGKYDDENDASAGADRTLLLSMSMI